MKSTGPQVEIFAFSGKTTAELAEQMRQLLSGSAAKAHPEPLKAASASLREEFQADAPCRLLVASGSADDAGETFSKTIQWLTSEEAAASTPSANIFFGSKAKPGKLAFLFPGQGSQYLHMGRALVETFDVSRSIIEKAEQAFGRDPSLFSFIYPEATDHQELVNQQEAALRDTAVAQPALGTLSLLMSHILKSHGIAPDAVGGHSFGELAALWAADRITETDFLDLAVARGRLMAEAGAASGDKGAMLAALAPLDKIEELIKRHGVDVILANRNSPKQGVLSGPTEAIEEMQAICKRNRVRTTRLPVSAAFHSRLVDDAAEPFKKIINAVDFKEGRIPVYANTTAAPYPEDPDEARHLLGGHLLNPVNFVDEIRHMYDDGVHTFVEVGPKSVLTGLVRNILSDQPHSAFSVDGSSGRQSALLDMACALCRMAALGYPVQLDRWPGSPAS